MIFDQITEDIYSKDFFIDIVHSQSSTIKVPTHFCYSKDCKWVFVSVSRRNSSVSDLAGGIYVFNIENGTKISDSLITRPGGDIAQTFGVCATNHDGSLLVAYGNTSDNVGRFFVFSRSGTTWNHIQTIAPQSSFRFSSSYPILSFDGSTLILRIDASAGNPTLNYYSWNGTSFVYRNTFCNAISSSDGISTAWYSSISNSGDTLILRISSIASSNSRKYEVWKRSGTTWSLFQSISPTVVDSLSSTDLPTISQDGNSIYITTADSSSIWEFNGTSYSQIFTGNIGYSAFDVSSDKNLITANFSSNSDRNPKIYYKNFSNIVSNLDFLDQSLFVGGYPKAINHDGSMIIFPLIRQNPLNSTRLWDSKIRIVRI